MFDVGGVSGGNVGSNYTPLIGTDDNSILGRDDFLMLLIAELQHQDPLEPLKNQEYIAQLTQFTSLDELRGIRGLLENQLAGEVTNLNAQSIGMIGREVTVLDETIEYKAGQEVELRLQLPSNTEVQVTLYNSRGQVVRQDTVLAGGSGGWQSYVFDGRGNEGNLLPEDTYYVQVATAPDAFGNMVLYPVYQSGRVTGVDFTGSVAMLELEGGQRVPLSNVVGVREVSEDA